MQLGTGYLDLDSSGVFDVALEALFFLWSATILQACGYFFFASCVALALTSLPFDINDLSNFFSSLLAACNFGSILLLSSALSVLRSSRFI